MQNEERKVQDIFEVKKKKALKQKSKKAKAAGLKSTFIVGDELLMTSFGKGNKAIPEKKITGEEIEKLNEDENFEVVSKNKSYNIKGRGIAADANNPLYASKTVGEDLIGCKNVLEERYFGKVFNDNIHIQLIYNILDIEKIMAIHINNIIYELDNLQRRDDVEYGDFIGYMSSRNTYNVFCNPTKYFTDEKIIKNLNNQLWQFDKYKNNPRLTYFGNVFYDKNRDRYNEGREKYNKDIKAKTKVDAAVARGVKFGKAVEELAPEFKLNEEKMYYIFSILGDIRQFCAHSSNYGRDYPYNLKKHLNNETKTVLDGLYSREIKTLNNGFIKNNDKNISIIFELFGARTTDDKENLIREFYEYVVKKAYKNIGFSVKTLRENMLVQNADHLLDKKYNDLRSKLYTLLDFIIYKYYDKDKIENCVNSLRACLTEDEKKDFYFDEANSLWNGIKEQVIKLSAKMNGNLIGKMRPLPADKELLEKTINKIAISDNTDYFCKVIYLMTIFLDGKEINDLLTTLINKFDNISSFVRVMEDRGISCNFKQNYLMFINSDKIVENLREINSFARMVKMEAKAKKALYIDALEILGIEMTNDELSEYIDAKMLSSNLGKGKHGLRNFIANNVIESARFKYLVRYSNPKKVREIANNRKVIEFVLRKIPDTQIDRYYESCFGTRNSDKEQQINLLTNIITGISFKNFEKVNQGARRGSFEYNEKQQKQAIISLYLTILYLLTKNLVYVNSRYFLAFHCLERDAQLKGSKAGYNREKYCELTQILIDEKKKNINAWFDGLSSPTGNQKKRKWRIERSCNYLEKNISHIDDKTIKIYRNNVEHLGPIRNINLYINDIKDFNSYFELYHYLVQRTLTETKDEFLPRPLIPQVEEYFNAIKTHHTYCKDFVKALNSPFGYNLPRFKNLSVDALFDKNNTPEKGE